MRDHDAVFRSGVEHSVPQALGEGREHQQIEHRLAVCPAPKVMTLGKSGLIASETKACST